MKDLAKLSIHGSPIITSSSRNDDLDITGSPLQDEIDSELMNTICDGQIIQSTPYDEQETCYGPIAINTAREILTDVINQKFPKSTQGWIFILCSEEGRPLEKSTWLISAYLNDEVFSRGIGNYYGIILHEKKSIKNLINRHNVLATGITPQHLEIQIENIFEFTQDITIKFINTLGDEQSSLSLIDKFTEVYLYQQVEIEKGNEICRELWEQICLLHAIQSDIVRFRQGTGDGTLVEPTYTYGSMAYDRLQERVNHVLSDVVTINDTDIGDTGLESVLRRVSTRPLTEVTDQLWDLIKFASSYTDLKRIITFVFQISSRSCIVNIPMNNNRMGELIRELTHQRLAIPHLTSTEPLELLLEIGMEKVMRDYEYIFKESKICMLSDINIGETKVKKLDNRFSVRKSLAPSVGAEAMTNNRKTLLHGVGNSPESMLEDLDEIRNSRFSERESGNIISKLAQIHLTIEHLLLIQSHLNLENDYTSIAKKKLERPLIPFEELQKQKFDKFEIPIIDKNVAQLVGKLIPNAQKVTMRSENKFKEVESVFYFNIEQIVPSLVRKENEEDQAPVDKNGNSFHSLSFVNIVSKF